MTGQVRERKRVKENVNLNCKMSDDIAVALPDVLRIFSDKNLCGNKHK